jgi:hypothetical protein
MALIIQTKQVQDFIQASTVRSEILFNTVVATVTLGVSHIPSVDVDCNDHDIGVRE